MDSFKKQLLTQISISLIILLALAAGLLFFGSSIKGYSEKIKGARQDLIIRSSDLSFLAALRTQYNTKGKDYLALLQSRVPPRDQLINLSREVQSLASDTSGFGFSFSGEQPPTDKTLGTINWTANLQVTLPQLTKFIDNVGKAKYLMAVDSFSLISQAGGVFQAPVRGQVFFR